MLKKIGYVLLLALFALCFQALFVATITTLLSLKI